MSVVFKTQGIPNAANGLDVCLVVIADFRPYSPDMHVHGPTFPKVAVSPDSDEQFFTGKYMAGMGEQELEQFIFLMAEGD